MIKRLTFMLVVLTAMALSGTASAACYADYKAKRDDPLRLHYGVMELPSAVCADQAQVPAEVTKRLADNDWTLLSILSVFFDDELENRRESAGDFFLRF